MKNETIDYTLVCNDKQEIVLNKNCYHWSVCNKEVKVAFLLTNLKPDFAIKNWISHSIYGKTNLRLQSKQSTSKLGSFGLVTETGFRFSFHLSEFGVIIPCGLSARYTTNSMAEEWDFSACSGTSGFNNISLHKLSKRS